MFAFPLMCHPTVLRHTTWRTAAFRSLRESLPVVLVLDGGAAENGMLVLHCVPMSAVFPRKCNIRARAGLTIIVTYRLNSTIIMKKTLKSNIKYVLRRLM